MIRELKEKDRAGNKLWKAELDACGYTWGVQRYGNESHRQVSMLGIIACCQLVADKNISALDFALHK